MFKFIEFRLVLAWIRRSVWVFPIIALIVLLALTAFKINGSSIGIYYSSLYGKTAKDPDLLFGIPQPIRSDEWRATTPITTLQVKTGFPTFNKALGTGHDLALSHEAPVKNWIGLFKPQNLIFFILPFQNAFAFRWWVVMYLLLIAMYFFILKILPGQKLLSTILSIAFVLSPYFLWWYQAPVFLPFAYALLIMIIAIRLINQEKIPKIKSLKITNLLYILAISYLGVCFALIIYAPFLIPTAIVVIAFLLGYLLDKKKQKKLSGKGFAKKFAPFSICLLIIACISFIALNEHSEIIKRIASSEYPGHRVIQSGQLPYSHLFPFFGAFLLPLLQTASHGLHYYANQSEASNFILLLPFLIVPGVLLQIYEYKRRGKITYTFLMLQLVSIIFFARISLHFGDSLYNLLMLNRVPNFRLLAAMGFLGFLQLIYFIKLTDDLKIPPRIKNYTSIIYGLLCFAILFVFGLYVKTRFPHFLNHYSLLVGLAVFYVAIIVAFVANKKMLGAVLLLLFTLGSSFKILPLYHGLNFFEKSEIIEKMESVSKTDDKWVVLDSTKYEAMPLIAGRGEIGGEQLYADLDLWHQMDKTHHFEYIYNRQGHALFLSNTLEPEPNKKFNVTSVSQDFELVKSNIFKVKFTCSDFTYKNVNYVLVTHSVDKSCLRLIDKVSYPTTKFYIYKVVMPDRSQT